MEEELFAMLVDIYRRSAASLPSACMLRVPCVVGACVPACEKLTAVPPRQPGDSAATLRRAVCGAEPPAATIAGTMTTIAYNETTKTNLTVYTIY